MRIHSCLILGFFILISAEMAVAQSRVCQLSRETYITVYRDLYIQALDRQIYPLTRNVNQIAPPQQDLEFQNKICGSVSLSPSEIKDIQVQVYANYFGRDEAIYPAQAKLKKFLFQETRSPEALQSFETIERFRHLLRDQTLTEEQKFSRLMQYANSLSQPQLRLYLDSSRDLLLFMADAGIDTEPFVQLLKKVYPSAEEFVLHVAQVSLLDEEEYTGLGAHQLRRHLAKSLQNVRIDGKLACMVSVLANKSLNVRRTEKEYTDLVNTLFTLFPETEKFSGTVCNEREAPSPTVQSLRESYKKELSFVEVKPKRLNFARSVREVVAQPVVPVATLANGVRCLEADFVKQFEVEKTKAHPQSRYLFGFSDSRGCNYSFDLEPQRVEKGKVKIRYRVSVSHPSFVLSDVGDAFAESLTGDVLQKIQQLGVRFESQGNRR